MDNNNNRLLSKNNLDEYGIKGDLLGKGGFGEIYQYGDVAVKSVEKYNDKNDINRSIIWEISALIYLNTENIIGIKDVFITPDKVYIVMEKCDISLARYIFENHDDDDNDEYKRKCDLYSYELIKAVLYCHNNSIIHRDIKPSNILLYNNYNKIKLIDFGLSRFSFDEVNMVCNNNIGTLRYRSPELLLKFRKYSYTIDNWAIGCTIAEMIDGTQIFRGDSDKEVLKNIFKYIGIPNENTWRGITNYLIPYNDFLDSTFIENKVNISEKYNCIVQGFLTVNPKNRLSLSDALKLDIFKDIIDDNKREESRYDTMFSSQDNIPCGIKRGVTKLNRYQHIDYIIKIKKSYKLSNRSLFLTIHIIDKCVDMSPDDTFKNNYFLLCVSALSLALTCEDYVNLNMEDYIKIGQNRYVSNQILDMKDYIFKLMNYNLIFHLSYDFLLYYQLNIKDISTRITPTSTLLKCLITLKHLARYESSDIALAIIIYELKKHKIDIPLELEGFICSFHTALSEDINEHMIMMNFNDIAIW